MPGRRVGDRRMVDVEPAHAADDVAVVVVVGIRQRRHVEPPDPELAQDLQRLALQLGGEIEHVVCGQPIDHDRVQRLGSGRVGLGGGGVVAGHLCLHHRALLDRPERLAGGPVEGEDQPLLRVLDEGRDRLAVDRQIHEDRRGGQVVVPLVAVVDLEVPPPLPGGDVQRQHAATEEVVARPMARVGLDGRGVRHQVDELQLRVGGRRRPGGHVARPAPGVVLPGLVAELARTGDDVELPAQRAGAGVEPHDVPRHVLDAGLVIAGLVTHEYHHHPVDHDRRRRGGDHAELPGNAVVRIVGPVPGQPGIPVGHERRDEVEDPGRREGVERHRRTPVLERTPGLGVKRPEEEGGRGDVDHAAAVDLGVSHPLAEVRTRRAEIAHRLRFAEGPERLAGTGVDRHRLAPLPGDGVEHTVGEHRGGPRGVLDPGAEVVATPNPGHFEIGEVRGVDLGQAGVRAGVAGVAAQITPLPVLDTSQLGSALSSRSQQAQRGEKAAGRSEWGHLIDPGAYGDSSVASAAAARAAASSPYSVSSR